MPPPRLQLLDDDVLRLILAATPDCEQFTFALLCRRTCALVREHRHGTVLHLPPGHPRPEFRSRIPVEIVTFSGRMKSRSSQVTLGYEPSDLGFYQDGLEIKGPLEEIKSTLGLLSWRKSSRPWRKSS